MNLSFERLCFFLAPWRDLFRRRQVSLGQRAASQPDLQLFPALLGRYRERDKILRRAARRAHSDRRRVVAERGVAAIEETRLFLEGVRKVLRQLDAVGPGRER